MASDDYVVNFPDERLRNIIKYKLGISNDNEITYGKLKTLETFSIQNEYSSNQAYYVKDIEGIQFLTSVIDMDLGGANFTNIEPLGGMYNIKRLNLKGSTSFTDLNPLSNVTNLDYLGLGAEYTKEYDLGYNNNETLDFSPIKYLTSLKSLELIGFSGDNDLSFVSGLDNLTELNLAGTSAKNYDPLKNLQKLSKLDLYSSSLFTLDFLSGLQNLRSLSLNNSLFWNELYNLNSIPSGIKELNIANNGSFSNFVNSGIEKFSNLEKLKVESFDTDDQFNILLNFPQLKDLTFSTPWSDGVYSFSNLGKLNTLKSLKISGKYDDIEDLASLKNLESLSFIVGDQVSDISAISGLSNLKSLDIGGSGVDISPIASLSNLKTLYMDVAEVRGEDAINLLSNLEELYFNSMGNLHIKDLSMISKLSNLRKIVSRGMDNYGNPGAISDITGLSGKDNLEHIEIRVNNVSNMPTLSNPQNLKVLDLYNNPVVVSSDALANMTNLEYLGTNVEDYSFIVNMDKLLYFNASGKNMTDFSALGKLSPVLTEHISRYIFQRSMATPVNRPFFKNPFRNIDGSYLKIPNTDTVKTVNANGELDPSGEYIILLNISDGDKGSTVVRNIYGRYPFVDITFDYDIVGLDKSKLAELVKNASQENSTVKSKIANELTTAEGILANDTIFLTQEQIDDIHNKLKEALSNAKNISIEKAIESSAMVAPHTGLSSGGMLMPLVALIIAIITSVFAWQTIRR